jgi:excisionase family DNA binding protein
MTSTLLTTKDVAKTFGVTSKTVRRWVKNGDLEALRIRGGHWRFEPEAVAKLLLHAKEGEWE